MDENCFTSYYTIGPGEISASQYELRVYYRHLQAELGQISMIVEIVTQIING